MEKKEIIKIINGFQNPYPKDIFLWDNQARIDFTRGRFNEFVYNVVENTKADIIRIIEEKV